MNEFRFEMELEGTPHQEELALEFNFFFHYIGTLLLPLIFL